MKTLKLFSSTLCLLIVSFSLTGQNHEAVTATTHVGEASGTLSDTLCQAAFSASPDSLTSYPFYYHFKDLSSGSLNSWHWDFGDGSFSTDKNPSHQYNGPGTYKVCLTIADQNDTNDCSDQTCLEITTLDYYSLGGLVYAGEYPLNNPVVAGDTGVASLYRIVDQQIVFVEDHYFQEYGYYWFGYLFPGEYMMKIGLTPGSASYKDYFTTYFGDDITWTKADLLSVSVSNLYAADIHLKPVQKLAQGQGTIKGFVNFEQGNAFSMPPISQTTVILSDINHTPLLFTRPNASGNFEFTGIPYDTYFLTADATGKPASTVTFTLSENSPTVEGINLTVFGSNTNIIPEKIVNGISFARIYPNPVRDDLHVSIYSGISAIVDIKVTDVTGKVFLTRSVTINTGPNQILLPASTLPQGIYILVLQPGNSYVPVTAKFIK